MNTGMRRIVQYSIRLGFVIVFLAVAATTIALASVSHSSDDQFNTIVLIYNCVLLAAELYFFLVVLYYGRSLEHAILTAEGGAIAGLETVPVKIRYLQMGAFSLVSTQLIPFAGCIVFAVYGSAPYFWVIQLCLSYFAIPSVTAATYGLARQHDVSSHSSKRLSKETSKSSKTGMHVAPITTAMETTTSE